MFTVDGEHSFWSFVVPFSFDPETFEAQSERLLAQRWRNPSPSREVPVWRPERLSTDELLPAIAAYINPGASTKATLMALELDGEAHAAFWGNPRHYSWFLTSVPDRSDLKFGALATHLFLFRTGAGFLALSVRPGEEWDEGTLLDFMHFFRLGVSRNQGTLKCQPRSQGGEHHAVWPPILAEKLEGATETSPHSIVRLLLDAEDEPWTEPVFESDAMLVFGATFLRSDLPLDAVEVRARLQVILGGILTYAHSRTPIDPSVRWGRGEIRRVGRDQFFTFGPGGSTFVGIGDQDEFILSGFSGALRKAYFPLFLLAQHQRVVLLTLAKRVAEKFIPPEPQQKLAAEGRSHEFERLRNRVFEFTSRGYFSQVSDNERMQAYYERWRDVLALDTLYREVSDRVGEISNAITSIRSLGLLRHVEVTTRQQAATAETLEYVELGVAGVYFLEAVALLLQYSGQDEQLLKHGPRLFGLALPFWIVLVAVTLGIVMLRRLLKALKKKFLARDANDTP